MFTVTDSAITKIKALLEENPHAAFRVAIQGGGCGGFQYKFDFADNIDLSDTVIEQDDVKVVVDPLSVGYLEEATLDYDTSDFWGESFKITNPAANTSCGCGSSFTLNV